MPSSWTRSATSTGWRPCSPTLGVPVTLVLETHLHNDYVTGGLALARRTGATYVVAGRDQVAFERCSVQRR